MTKVTYRMTILAAAVLSTVTLGACSTSQVANTTGDVVGTVGRGTVHAVAGAGRLAGRGISAGFNALTDDD
ncbi:hypothetical protein [Gymnodinialimonas hymeniacidonis]|uniref:hypothetical protein n=1 Tax=Gymnodinialimonas hymeniacidonis TaxID=3126508 RepID=UPI0034C60AC0